MSATVSIRLLVKGRDARVKCKVEGIEVTWGDDLAFIDEDNVDLALAPTCRIRDAVLAPEPRRAPLLKVRRHHAALEVEVAPIASIADIGDERVRVRRRVDECCVCPMKEGVLKMRLDRRRPVRLSQSEMD